MSDDLYVTRLRWHGGGGVAKFLRCSVPLASAPNLGFRYVELDYAPPVCCQVRREAWHQIDDMLPDERAACVRYLEDMLEPPNMTVEGP